MSVQPLATTINVEANVDFSMEDSAPVTPSMFRLPLVLVGPGSMETPSIRLTVPQMLQLKFVTVVNRHTFTVPRKTYGTVVLTVNNMEVFVMGTPCTLRWLETGFVAKVVSSDIITATMDTAVMTSVVPSPKLPVLRLELDSAQHPTTHSRQLATTRQLVITTRCLNSVQQKPWVFPLIGGTNVPRTPPTPTLVCGLLMPDRLPG